MTRSQILRERGWQPTGRGEWFKRGWTFTLEDAYAYESLADRNNYILPDARYYDGAYLRGLIAEEKLNKPMVKGGHNEPA